MCHTISEATSLSATNHTFVIEDALVSFPD